MKNNFKSSLPSRQRLYEASPRIMQRVLVNLEAWRRDQFRRYGDYTSKLNHYNPQWYASTREAQEDYQIERLRELVQVARQHVPHYRHTLPNILVNSLNDLLLLPILEKDAFRSDPMSLTSDTVSIKDLRLQTTSGSTGTPLRYYQDRSAIQAHEVAVIEPLMAMYDCHFGERRARISGPYVAPYEQTEPPFWIYIDRYRQLQCSAYHLGPDTYRYYLQAMREAQCTYGTGYATAWHILASCILDAGGQPPSMKAIFTDSEGISLDQQATVEHAFGCPVVQTYGMGEVGTIAIQCREKRYHVLTRACIAEILNDHDQPVLPGETGQVVVTDLTSLVTPFIRYRTGDLATLAADTCHCGWFSPSWTAIVGRVDDQIKTPEGRWVGRLSHVTKPAIGIRESQIVQTAVDRVVIKVVPDRDFDPTSMDAVLAAAHRYLGHTMQVSWETVNKLERTPRGKLRHVVREIEV